MSELHSGLPVTFDREEEDREMGRDKIIGREAECERLEKCLRADQAQLVIIYGRRRVGKTFLINQFFDGRFDFKTNRRIAQNQKKRSCAILLLS